MATLEKWTKYLTDEHTLALIEDDLRTIASDPEWYDAHIVAESILAKRF